ncbi:uncharacterized protein N7482_010647 [Penicillium canariense]|uniref:Polyketide synthase n=1 Tax=Penicillium canariense TaxID=189055 RepID=A0A9W9HM97_9EURO|nr:uncharacterized protein N7482_010647 [Penicillium canariense]KAJ5151395.1 hypothetical protein N7482_010647 [Penicillium canariense]
MKPETHIFLFGDQTYDFAPDLRRLLSCQTKPILAAFLEQSHYVIRAQSNLWLSAAERQASRSASLAHLLQKYCEGTLSPAFQVSLHALTQLGSFICHYEEPGAVYPSPGSAYLVGLCTGGLAAAAIASSSSLSELLPAAVHTVQVALRLGLLAVDVRDRIECPEAGQPSQWSMLFFGLDEQVARAGLGEFIRTKGVPHLSKPFISAHAGKALTISGSPSVLQELQSAPGFAQYQSKPIPIFLPAHGRHLFSQKDVATILETTVAAQWSGFNAKLPVISGASGVPVWAGGFVALLERALGDCLLEPIRWDKVVSNFRSLVGGSGAEAITITPIATNLEHNLSARLKEMANVHVQPLDGLQEARLYSTPRARSKLAIVGMSGRFPESPSPEAFWDLLYQGLDVCKEVPAKRWDWRTHVTHDGKGHNLGGTKWGCWLDFADQFDPRFFSISPKEAPQMDPAQRMALMTTYEALQGAGFVSNTTPASQQDRVGVFHGVTSNDYLECNSGQFIDTYFITGGNRAFIPGRINFCFEFCGPSYTNDTACSSSLAAIHLACNSLWRGDCDTAIAGGTNMCINPDGHTGLDKGFFLSRTGNCKPFDDAADGYCRGEAVATVVIKRLEDAIAEKDPILGVILDVKTNHSAMADSMTRPHVHAQVDNMNAVLSTVNLHSSEVDYVEMHGTGTQVGDAVEMASVLRVFAPDESTRTAENPLHVGTVKANIGHGEGVSGISSLCKVLLMMKHDTIPPHCGIKTGSRINRNYPDLPARHVHIPLGPTPWTRGSGRPRRALINNFSAAGGNTALLLEDAPVLPAAETEEDPRNSHIVTVSGHVAAALRKNLQQLVAYIRKEEQQNPDFSLAQLSWTTTARRQQHVFRVSASGSDVNEIANKLQAALDRGDGSTRPKSKPKVLFAFTGQGAQYLGMGRQLLEAYPTFRSDIEHFDFMAQGLGFPSFLQILQQKDGSIDQYPPVTVQLATTAIQMALTKLLISFGIRPHAVTGHSLGLYAALQAAGVLTVADTLFLVGQRAQFLQEFCQQGTHAMLAIKGSRHTISHLLAHQQCEVACVNGPEDLVVSGSNAQVQAAQAILAQNRINATLLKVPFAFHSAQVDPILAPFTTSAAGARFRAPTVPVLCPLTGSVVQADGVFSPEYLARHCREAVDMAGALLAAQSAQVIDAKTFTLEIGPHPVVCGMVRATLGKEMRTLPILQRGATVWPNLTAALQALYESGADLDWCAYHAPFDAAHTVLELPAYGWDLKSYWIDYENDWCIYKPYGRPNATQSKVSPKASVQAAPPVPPKAPRKSIPQPQTSTVHRMVEESVDAGTLRLVFEGDLSRDDIKHLAPGHIVNGIPFTVPSWFADMALVLGKYAHQRFASGRSVVLDVAEVVADKVLVPHARGPQPIRVSLTAPFTENMPDSLRDGKIEFYSVDANGKTTSRHGYGILRFSDSSLLKTMQAGLPAYKSRIQRLRDDVAQGELTRYNKKSGYRLMSRVADFGPDYKLLDDLVVDEDTLEATCIVNFSNIAPGGTFAAHPGCIDAFTQVGGFAINARGCMDLDVEVFISHGWLSFQLYEELKADTKYELYVQMHADGHEFYRGDTVVLDQGRLVAFFKGVTYQKVVTQSLHQRSSPTKTNDAAPRGLTPSSTKATAKVQLPAPSPRVAIQPPPSIKRAVKPVIPMQPERPAPPVPSAQPVAPPKSSRPTPPIIAQVMAIVSEESGIAEAELTDDSNFADMGIDSLCSMVIGSRLREDLALDLDADFSIFVSCPTVKQLKSFLVELDGASGSGSSSESSAVMVEEPVEEEPSEELVEIELVEKPVSVSASRSFDSTRLPSSSSTIAPYSVQDLTKAAPLGFDGYQHASSSTPSFSSGPDLKIPIAVAEEQSTRYETVHYSAGLTDRACSSKPRSESKPKKAAMATSLVQDALAIVSDESGLSLEDLTDDSNFADIGVDSLCSMVIQSRLREELHVDLDADFSIFLNCPTVGDLKIFLVNTDDGEAGQEDASSSVSSSSDASPITTPDDSGSDGDGDFDTDPSLRLANLSSECRPATSVILQGIPKLARKTLFLLPDGSGSRNLLRANSSPFLGRRHCRPELPLRP